MSELSYWNQPEYFYLGSDEVIKSVKYSEWEFDKEDGTGTCFDIKDIGRFEKGDFDGMAEFKSDATLPVIEKEMKDGYVYIAIAKDEMEAADAIDDLAGRYEYHSYEVKFYTLNGTWLDGDFDWPGKDKEEALEITDDDTYLGTYASVEDCIESNPYLEFYNEDFYKKAKRLLKNGPAFQNEEKRFCVDGIEATLKAENGKFDMLRIENHNKDDVMLVLRNGVDPLPPVEIPAEDYIVMQPGKEPYDAIVLGMFINGNIDVYFQDKEVLVSHDNDEDIEYRMDEALTKIDEMQQPKAEKNIER